METLKVIDDTIEITTTKEINIVTKTSEELTGERAEAQTKVDHLKIDLAEAEAKVTAIDTKIALLVTK